MCVCIYLYLRLYLYIYLKALLIEKSYKFYSQLYSFGNINVVVKMVPGVRQVESDWTSVQQPWCLSSKKEFRAKMTRNYKRKFI